MNKAIYVLVAIAVVASLAHFFITNKERTEVVACTMDALQCPDGSYVGRSGPNCQFVCPALPEVPDDIQAHIDEKADLIVLSTPVPNGVIETPLLLTGQARGQWFFEGSFPILLANEDQSIIIAKGYATANRDWMTNEFVPFTATLDFDIQSFREGGYDISKGATLVLKIDNPSGLPENDDSLEIPIRFAP